MHNSPATTATCGQARTPGTTRVPAPAPAVVLVVVVLLLTTALTTHGTTAQTALATLASAGLLGIELVRRLAEALTTRRAR